MRSNGATSARLGDVALTLGAPIAPVQALVELPSPDSAEDRQRSDLETLLYSSGGDVGAFMKVRGYP